jgi:hypothetical protein
MAHELAHIKNRDTLTMTITATIAGAISMLANFAFFFGGGRNNPLGIFGAILIMILAPLAAGLVQMAISAPASTPPTAPGRDLRPAAVAASALEKIDKRRRASTTRRRAQSGDGAHVHHQPPRRCAGWARSSICWRASSPGRCRRNPATPAKSSSSPPPRSCSCACQPMRPSTLPSSLPARTAMRAISPG